MSQGKKRPTCFNCGVKRVPEDNRLFCTQRCGWEWAETHAWNLQDIGVNEEGEYEQGLAGCDLEAYG